MVSPSQIDELKYGLISGVSHAGWSRFVVGVRCQGRERERGRVLNKNLFFLLSYDFLVVEICRRNIYFLQSFISGHLTADTTATATTITTTITTTTTAAAVATTTTTTTTTTAAATAAATATTTTTLYMRYWYFPCLDYDSVGKG